MTFRHLNIKKLDLVLTSSAGNLFIRLPNWGDGSCVLMVAPPHPLPDAPTPALIGLDCHIALQQGKLLIPLGFQSTDKLLQSLESWLQASGPLIQKNLINFWPLGFCLYGSVKEEQYELCMIDCRENPSRDRFSITFDSAVAAQWRVQIQRGTDFLQAARSTG